MRFSRLTHLSMCLSSVTLTSIIRTGKPILVELIDLVNFVLIFRPVLFCCNFCCCDFHSPALFLSSDASIYSIMTFPPLGISDMLCQFPLTLHQTETECPVWLYSLWLFSCWLGRSSWSFERCSMRIYL